MDRSRPRHAGYPAPVGASELPLHADIRGFGVASDLAWHDFGGVAYGFSEWRGGIIGYRHLDVDHDHDDFVWDASIGPVIGATFRF